MVKDEEVITDAAVLQLILSINYEETPLEAAQVNGKRIRDVTVDVIHGKFEKEKQIAIPPLKVPYCL